VSKAKTVAKTTKTRQLETVSNKSARKPRRATAAASTFPESAGFADKSIQIFGQSVIGRSGLRE
jgi:hypothetical protein